MRVFDTTSAFDLYNSPEDSAVIRSLEVNGRLPVYDHLKEAAGNKPLNYETALDVSGGNDNTQYFVSGGWSHQGGIINNTNAGRQSLRMNLDQRLNEKLKLTLSNSFTRTTTNRGTTNNDNSGAGITYALAYIPSFVPLEPVNGVYPQPAFTYQGANPLQTIALAANAETVNRFTGGATLTYQALQGGKHDLKLVGAAGADLFNQKNMVYAPPDLYFEATQQYPGVSTLGNADSRYVNWNVNAINAFTPCGSVNDVHDLGRVAVRGPAARAGARHRERPARGTIEHRSGGDVRPAVRAQHAREDVRHVWPGAAESVR